MEWLISAASIAATAAIGYGTYKVSMRRVRTEESQSISAKHGEIVDDALELKDVFKAEYAELRKEVKALRIEVEALKMELANERKWRGVAENIAIEYVEQCGERPKSWPVHVPWPEEER